MTYTVAAMSCGSSGVLSIYDKIISSCHFFHVSRTTDTTSKADPAAILFNFKYIYMYMVLLGIE